MLPPDGGLSLLSSLSGAAKAVGSIAGLFGGKGTYARTTGLQVTGTLSKDGFTGSYFGLADNAGEKYKDLLPNWHPAPYVNSVLVDAFRSTFGNTDQSIAIDFIGPAEESAGNRAFSTAAANYVRSLGHSFFSPGMNAPSLTSPATPGASTAAPSPGVSANGLAAPVIGGAAPASAPAIIIPGLNGVSQEQIVLGIGLALFAWYLAKKG